MNQTSLSTVKDGKLAIYCHHFVLGQLLVAANQPENIDKNVCKKNEVKLIACICNKSTGDFQCIKLCLGYIILRGDREESFFSYGVWGEFLKSFSPDKVKVDFQPHLLNSSDAEKRDLQVELLCNFFRLKKAMPILLEMQTIYLH